MKGVREGKEEGRCQFGESKYSVKVATPVNLANIFERVDNVASPEEQSVKQSFLKKSGQRCYKK